MCYNVSKHVEAVSSEVTSLSIEVRGDAPNRYRRVCGPLLSWPSLWLTCSRAPHDTDRTGGAVADTPVSIREVAALAGVSLGTVSNVLNRPEVVAEPTRTRVQAAIKELGFIRNESARQLRAGRQPHHRAGRSRRGQPVLHRRGAGRGGRGERGRAGRDPVQQRRPEGQGVPLPRSAGRAPGPGHPDHAGVRGRQAAGQRAAPRHPGGAGGQPVPVARPVLGVRGRRARRRPGRIPSAGGGSPADRVRGRADERAPGQRPPGRGGPRPGAGRADRC